MTIEPLRVGLVGCGNISDIYITNADRLGGYSIVACADVEAERARAKAEQHGIARHCSFPEMLEDPGINLILNLTPPGSHAEIGLAAVEAGKHVYNEKPLSIELAEARQMLAGAERRGLLVGCAPDTFLGAGYGTCRRLLGEGAIGVPVGAVGFMMCRGPELWHPDPAFFYRRGAGPLFDMGPYYITAMISLFGPVRRVAGLARISFAEREVVSEPLRGTKIAVETPTHVCATLEFAAGPIATLVMSFDVWSHAMPPIELYGGEGTLTAPDPNTFGGPVRLRVRAEAEAREVPLDAGHAENSRGLGLRDMAAALAERREPAAGGALALHVLETMHAILRAAAQGQAVTVESPCPLQGPAVATGSPD